jgi:hypothetical protein
MTRVVDWSEGRPATQGAMRAAAALSERLAASKRAGSTRLRSPEDVAIITRMALVEIARRAREGRLVRIGPREYELRIPE